MHRGGNECKIVIIPLGKTDDASFIVSDRSANAFARQNLKYGSRRLLVVVNYQYVRGRMDVLRLTAKDLSRLSFRMNRCCAVYFALVHLLSTPSYHDMAYKLRSFISVSGLSLKYQSINLLSALAKSAHGESGYSAISCLYICVAAGRSVFRRQFPI